MYHKPYSPRTQGLRRTMRSEHEDQDTRQGPTVITEGFLVSSLEHSQWEVRAGCAEELRCGWMGNSRSSRGIGERRNGEQRDGWVGAGYG